MGVWRRGVVVGRARRKKKTKKHRCSDTMERKLRQLQKIIPGGGAAGQVVDMEALFQRIAVYIFLLELRVKLLKDAYNFFGPD